MTYKYEYYMYNKPTEVSKACVFRSSIVNAFNFSDFVVSTHNLGTISLHSKSIVAQHQLGIHTFDIAL